MQGAKPPAGARGVPALSPFPKRLGDDALGLFFTWEQQDRDERITGAAQNEQGKDNSFSIITWCDEHSDSPPEAANEDGK